MIDSKLFSALLLCSVLSACGGGGSSDSGADDGADSSQPPVASDGEVGAAVDDDSVDTENDDDQDPVDELVVDDPVVDNVVVDDADNNLADGLTLSDGGRVLALTIDRALVDDRDGLDGDELKQLSASLYRSFADDFDFIFFVSAFSSATVPDSLPYSGRYSSVRSAETGTGWSAYDNSGDYGSDGQLQGIIHLAKLEGLRQGPSLHELMHRWGNFGLPSVYFSHWAFASSGQSLGGQLGGFASDSLADLGAGQYRANNGMGSSFGSFANGGNGLPYSVYELYLMGLAASSELPDYRYFDDAQWLDQGQGIFSSVAGPKTMTVDQVLTSLGGPRQPAFGQAQNHFKVLTVLLHEGQPDVSMIDKLDADMALFAYAGDDSSALYNFYEATLGRASLAADGLSASLK